MEQATQTSPAVRFDSRLWGLLLLLCGVLFLDGMDVSMVAVALPNIGHELDLGNSSLQWIVSGYVLGYGGLLLLGGRAADLIGRRKVLLGGLAVFIVASFIGGIAALDRMGELDRTLTIVLSDNGASSEGGPVGSLNDGRMWNVLPQSVEE